jgi:hypothetical protein
MQYYSATKMTEQAGYQGHAWNPNYLGGGDCNQRLSLGQKYETLSEKTIEAKRAGGVANGRVFARPEFKTPEPEREREALNWAKSKFEIVCMSSCKNLL